MKHVMKLALVCAMTALSATAFAGGNKESASASTSIKTKADLNGKIYGIFEVQQAMTVDSVNEFLGFKPSSIVTLYKLNEGLADLKSGRVDALGLSDIVATYFSTFDNTLSSVPLVDIELVRHESYMIGWLRYQIKGGQKGIFWPAPSIWGNATCGCVSGNGQVPSRRDKAVNGYSQIR